MAAGGRLPRACSAQPSPRRACREPLRLLVRPAFRSNYGTVGLRFQSALRISVLEVLMAPVNPLPIARVMTIGSYPYVAARGLGHITSFRIGRPVPGPRLRPIASTKSSAGVGSERNSRLHRHYCGNEGGCGQAGEHRFGQPHLPATVSRQDRARYCPRRRSRCRSSSADIPKDRRARMKVAHGVRSYGAPIDRASCHGTSRAPESRPICQMQRRRPRSAR
jgi:hypothetical protein